MLQKNCIFFDFLSTKGMAGRFPLGCVAGTAATGGIHAAPTNRPVISTIIYGRGRGDPTTPGKFPAVCRGRIYASRAVYPLDCIIGNGCNGRSMTAPTGQLGNLHQHDLGAPLGAELVPPGAGAAADDGGAAFGDSLFAVVAFISCCHTHRARPARRGCVRLKSDPRRRLPRF